MIKHHYIKGSTAKKIKDELGLVHGTSAPSFATVYNWLNEFTCGRTPTKDRPWSGRPLEVTTPEMIDEIQDMLLADRRLKLSEIFEVTGISKGSVVSILHEKLCMKRFPQDGCRVCSQSKINGIE